MSVVDIAGTFALGGLSYALGRIHGHASARDKWLPKMIALVDECRVGWQRCVATIGAMEDGLRAGLSHDEIRIIAASMMSEGHEVLH